MSDHKSIEVECLINAQIKNSIFGVKFLRIKSPVTS